jgi:hypothetical protein
MAGWTGRLLTGPRQVLEPTTAVTAGELEQGHAAYYEAIGV